MSEVLRFNREARANLDHALVHLNYNRIAENVHDGWYSGNREQFIKRHVKAIAFLKSLMKLNGVFVEKGKA